MDTSNLLDTPFTNPTLRKKLKMFLFVSDSPRIKQVVAVNPKEYRCQYEDDDIDTRHKGVPNKVKLNLQTYADRVFRILA